MDAILPTLLGVFGDSATLTLAALVFLATATLTFGFMAAVRVRGAVKRRASVLTAEDHLSVHSGDGSLRGSSLKAVSRILDYTTKHYASGDNKDMKVLRRRLVQAGIYDSRAVAFFFLARAVCAIGFGIGVFFVMPMITAKGGALFWLFVMCGGIAGYVAPSLYIDKVVGSKREEHRAGFPDFMDLLVVCADSGLSMEAALERVGRELGDSYPSLCQNIHIANLEIRAGRTLPEALEHLAERLSLDEARSFSTLIQQSIELGSSITEALRVYSDDMRHKRLSRAEEKAYSLPARLAVPMMVCIFPVLFVVILLPVFVRLHVGAY